MGQLEVKVAYMGQWSMIRSKHPTIPRCPLFFRHLAWALKTVCPAVFAVVSLLAKTIGAILGNVGAVAHSAMVGDGFLDHAAHFAITCFFPTTPLVSLRTLCLSGELHY